jgi:SAM-dependent methyltransferase
MSEAHMSLSESPPAGQRRDFTSPGSRATLHSASGGKLLLRLPGQAESGDAVSSVEVRLDDRAWATLPVLPAFDGSNRRELTFSVPPHDGAAEMDVECRDAAGGAVLAQGRFSFAEPLTNPHGLPASDIYDPAMRPLFSVPWMEFDGAFITISGAHLPPAGDPGRLSVEFAEGVVGSFEYPLASPEFGSHYWYWPNAHMSGFRVRINLPASAAAADAFSFRFVTRHDEVPFLRDQAHTGSFGSWPDHDRIWIPSDLRSWMNFPGNESLLSRVQTWSNQRTVAFTGYNAFRAFESLAAHHGVTPWDGMKVLDWGCGHGRVARHFITHWPNAAITGVDVDGENIAWCRENLSGGTFQVAPLWPPLDLASDSFDLIIGLSVMTHLSASAQEAWIAELRRILKPGGLALITFGGEGAAAYASIHHDPDWWRRWIETGFNDEQNDPALGSSIADDRYYRVTHQSAQRTRAAWSREMTVVHIEPQAFGYQDVAVLRAE